MDTIQVVIMEETEARLLVDEIRAGITSVGDKLLELYDREGWRALGYQTWRDCVMTEFNFSQSRVYQLLAHAEVIKNIAADSTMVEKPATERQARPLVNLPPAQQPEAWKQAQARAGTLQPTAKQVEQVVKSFTKESQTRNSPKGSRGGVQPIVLGDDINQLPAEDRINSVAKQKAVDALSEFDDGVCCPYCERKY